jgi:hypothetical protein
VTSIATNTTDDVGGEVALLGAVVLAVTDLTTYYTVRNHEKDKMGRGVLTVLASLVLIVTKSTVEGSQLTELVALKFILTLRDGRGLEDNQHMYRKGENEA